LREKPTKLFVFYVGFGESKEACRSKVLLRDACLLLQLEHGKIQVELPHDFSLVMGQENPIRGLKDKHDWGGMRVLAFSKKEPLEFGKSRKRWRECIGELIYYRKTRSKESPKG